MVPEPQTIAQNVMYHGATYAVAEPPQGAMTYTSQALGLTSTGGE
jgi:hypothetical protein